KAYNKSRCVRVYRDGPRLLASGACGFASAAFYGAPDGTDAPQEKGGTCMEPKKTRESFASRLGFILVSAGCAIGIGNVWRFPTVTGENGGGVFVLFYLLFLVIMGIPVLTMELAVGRAGRGSAGMAYKA